MSQVIILPGNGCTPIEDCNWYSWLYQQLQAVGVPVCMQDMPDPYVAREAVWLPFIQESWNPDVNTIVVGHSSGAEAAMRLAESTRLKAIVLVSACHTDLGIANEAASGYYSRPWLWDCIQANCDYIVQFGSPDDPFIPMSEQLFVSTNLKSKFLTFPGRGHFMESTCPEVLKEVLELLTPPPAE